MIIRALKPPYRGMFLLEMLPFVLRLICFSVGASLTVFILWPCLLVLTVLNFRRMYSIKLFALSQGILALCGLISGLVFTVLYCSFISGDPMSWGLGFGLSVVGMCWILLLTAILVIVKMIMKQQKR